MGSWQDENGRWRDSKGRFTVPDNSPSGDGSSAVILSELRALRAELSELKRESRANTNTATNWRRDLQRLLFLKINSIAENRQNSRTEKAIAKISDRLSAKIDATKEDLEGLFVQIIALFILATAMGLATGGLIAAKKIAEALPGHQWFEEAQPTTAEMTWQSAFEGGSDSLVAIAIGNAEGTRTPDGGKTSAYQAHTDPGNGVVNQGTFSYQHGAASPEEADQKQLDRLKGQLEAIAPQIKRTDIKTWLNAADLLNQSPLAGQSFPKYLEQCSGDILCARVKSYEGDAPGITRNGITIEQDQRRRMDAIDRAIAANAAKVPSGNGKRVMPVAGEIQVNSEYGQRTFQGRPSMHWGIDLNCAVGQPLLATEAGTIRHFADPDGFGNYAVALVTASGDELIYGHNSKRLVGDGASVQAGTPIAACGNEGKSTGPHLHFEIRKGGDRGDRPDPRPYLENIAPLPARAATNIVN